MGTHESSTASFTLVVLVLVGIMASIVTPLLRPEGFRMNSALVEVGTTLTGQRGNAVLRNALYVVDALSRDIPTAGTNVPARQPTLVYGGEDVIAFSADYATNVANDVLAVYIDPDAPTSQVTVAGSGVAIPNTSWSWPDSAYVTAAGTSSPGELIIVFLAEGETTSREDDYALFRQVNAGTPELVSSHILPALDDVPFFRYFHQVDSDDASSILDSIPRDSIPIRHSEPRRPQRGPGAGQPLRRPSARVAA